MRKLTCTRVIKTYSVSAKSLKKGDRIWVGKRIHTVASNKKNDHGQRVIRLKWGSRNKKDEVLLVVNRRLEFVVQTTQHKKSSK